MKKTILPVLAAAILCCGVMAAVDGVLRPGYAVKSAVKLLLFLGAPLALSRLTRVSTVKDWLRPRKGGIRAALGLGVGLYALIVGGYLLLRQFVDFTPIVGALSQNAGVTRGNFLFISLYISFINSLLEEFFFRGFLFLNLRRYSPVLAHIFSAAVFSLYHTAMMLGWFSPWLFALALLGLFLGGLIFNFLDARPGNIYTSWLVHMFANFAINTVGFLLMG